MKIEFEIIEQLKNNIEALIPVKEFGNFKFGVGPR